MPSKPIKVPSPDHPITIEPNPSRVVVLVGGRVVAESREVLTLREAKYPAVQYIPRKDVDMSLLQRTDHATYCPYKGDCAYYSIPAGGERSINAVWTYEAPYAAAFHVCEACTFKDSCRAWLARAPAEVNFAPRFCPGADILFELQFDQPGLLH